MRAMHWPVIPGVRGGERLSSGFDVPLTRAIAHGVAGVRETFEESGVWLGAGTLPAALRLALQEGGASLADALAAHHARVDLDTLVPWSWWVTPQAEPKRYDTRFLAARAPSSRADHDDSRGRGQPLGDCPSHRARRQTRGVSTGAAHVVDSAGAVGVHIGRPGPLQPTPGVPAHPTPPAVRRQRREAVATWASGTRRVIDPGASGSDHLRRLMGGVARRGATARFARFGLKGSGYRASDLPPRPRARGRTPRQEARAPGSVRDTPRSCQDRAMYLVVSISVSVHVCTW